MSIEERPQLEYVANSQLENYEANGVIWRSGINVNVTTCSEFEYGTATLRPGARGNITPGARFEESSCEAAALITSGVATVTVDEEEHQLTAYDCLFSPPDGEYTLENRSDTPVEFLWGIASSNDSEENLETDPIDHGGVAQVVHTLRDIEVSVTLDPGHCSRVWTAVFPQTVGATDLTMGIIKRPSGSVAPLHEHAPPTLTEAFTVLDGRLLITDHAERETVLDPGEFMYIPERGMHRNQSIHMDGTTYAFIENPARDRDYAPFNMADSTTE